MVQAGAGNLEVPDSIRYIPLPMAMKLLAMDR